MRWREHYREDGETKDVFVSKKDAKRHILRMKAQGAEIGNMRAYKCSICGKYHIGHRPKFQQPDLWERVIDFENRTTKYFNGGGKIMKVIPTDARWNGEDKQKKLCDMLDVMMSNARVVFGTYNNALFLMMADVIDQVKRMKGYGFQTKKDVSQVWKAWKMYEAQLKYSSSMMKMEGLTADARKFYGEDMTDADLYDFWCATGSAPYSILKKWTAVLANKFRVLVESRGGSNPEVSGWLMAVNNLFAFQEEIWKRIVTDMAVPNGLRREGLEKGLMVFRMNGIAKAWWVLMRDVCPELKTIQPDEIEEKNIKVSMDQIIEHVDTNEFYFGGVENATEDFEEVFRTRGMQDKALRQMREARAEMEG